MLWSPHGESIAVLARWHAPADRLHEGLPDGVRPFPGPCVVTAGRTWRNGGPLVDLRVHIAVRAGLRVRWLRVVRVADRAAGGTDTVTWSVERDGRGTRVVHWVEQGVTLRVTPGRVAVPVSGRWGRIGRGELRAPARSRLAPLAGRHRGLVVGAPSPSEGTVVAPVAVAPALPLRPLSRPVIGGASPAAVMLDRPGRRIDCADLALVSTLPVGTGA